MGKILHISDSHSYTAGKDQEIRSKSISDIVQTANNSMVDTLAHTGDVIEGHKSSAKIFSKQEQQVIQFTNVYLQAIQTEDPSAIIKEHLGVDLSLEQIEEQKEEVIQTAQQLAQKYMQFTQSSYSDFNERIGSFKGDVEMTPGNHDTPNLEDVVTNANFEPTENIGKYFFQTGAPNMVPIMLTHDNSSMEYANHLTEEKPAIALFHQAPYSNKYFKAPEWTSKIESKIRLYGHNHPKEGYKINYDEETKVLDVNVCTEMGYFAIIETDAEDNPKHIDVYRDNNIAELYENEENKAA